MVQHEYCLFIMHYEVSSNVAKTKKKVITNFFYDVIHLFLTLLENRGTDVSERITYF